MLGIGPRHVTFLGYVGVKKKWLYFYYTLSQDSLGFSRQAWKLQRPAKIPASEFLWRFCRNAVCGGRKSNSTGLLEGIGRPKGLAVSAQGQERGNNAGSRGNGCRSVRESRCRGKRHV